MSETAVQSMPPPARELSRKAAIVGVGETDYHLDYRAERARAPGSIEREFRHAGFERHDISDDQHL